MSRNLKRRNVSAIVFLFVFAAATIFAQSGRTIKKTNLPAPMPEPTVAATPAPVPKPSIKPEIKFKVVTDLSPSTSSAGFYAENMTRWFTERLGKSPLIEIVSSKSGTRKDAQAAAESASDEFVVFLELNRALSSTASASTRTAVEELQVDYLVFEPKTGKRKTSGTTYPERRSTVGGGLDRRVCYANLRDEEYLLLLASFEAAERIMSKFNLVIPPVKCSGRELFGVFEFNQLMVESVPSI